MKKILNEQRLCELAGIAEADTVDMHKSKLDARKRARHQAEKGFFGGDEDPLVTTDVPDSRLTNPAEGDPNATHAMSADQLAQIQKDVPDEARRPVAMKLYQDLIAPKYGEEELEVIVHNDQDVNDALSQLVGWFHPAFHDSRGLPTYDNPSMYGVQVAQEFEKEGLDIIDDAELFQRRVEKYSTDDARKQVKQNVAAREPARNVKVGRSATPGTPEHQALQDLFKKIDAEDEFGGAPTGKLTR